MTTLLEVPKYGFCCIARMTMICVLLTQSALIGAEPQEPLALEATKERDDAAGLGGERRSLVPGFILRTLSHKLRELDERELVLVKEMSDLPTVDPQPSPSSAGFHSRASFEVLDRKWVQVDFGRIETVEDIILIPADVATGFYPGPGYGFPVCFRVELSNDEDFVDSRIVADHSDRAYPNPGAFPVRIQVDGQAARYLRITATRLWQSREGVGVFALGELVVLSQGRNIALGRRVTASDTVDREILWSRGNLVDGQSMLGIPTGAPDDYSNGYHSLEGETDKDAVKWVEVDLGRPYVLDEIWLIPAHPPDYADLKGFGFPVRFRVDVIRDESSREPVWSAVHTDADFPNPGNNPVVYRVPDVEGRYVRVTATVLWERANDYAFALAELQAFSGTTNVAFGAQVTALDSVEYAKDGPPDARYKWGAEYLVDGRSSRHEMVEYSDWLQRLARRRELDLELRSVDERRALLVASLNRTLMQGSVVTGGFLVLGVVALIYQFRLRRQHEMERLRARIASDLHDEIGSNLGSISLLSRLMQKKTSAPDESHQVFGEIHAVASRTLESMRDIVWLINPDHDQMDDLVLRMRETAQAMLSGIPHTFQIKGPNPTRKLSVEFQRHVFLILKEILHNIIRHAEATEVDILLKEESQKLRLHIRDNGRGFDPAVTHSGQGLQNLKQRVARLRGEYHLFSQPGAGTEIDIVIPVNRVADSALEPIT